MFAKLKNMHARIKNYHVVVTNLPAGNLPACRYYEEKVIDGILYYRSSPDAAWIEPTTYQLSQMIYYRGKDCIHGLCRVLRLYLSK